MPPKFRTKRKAKGKTAESGAGAAMSAAAAAAEGHKQLGNDAFKAGDFMSAIASYTAAIEADGRNHVLFSNRSAAHFSNGDFEAAEADAKTCVEIKPDFPKGHVRLGDALLAAGRPS